MNYENDEKSNNFEIENNNDYISKDKTTAITKEKTNNNLGNKRKRYEEDKEIKDLNDIKKISNVFEEGKKNEDLNEEETIFIFKFFFFFDINMILNKLINCKILGFFIKL